MGSKGESLPHIIRTSRISTELQPPPSAASIVANRHGLPSMDPRAAGNAAAASHTVGGRPVNTSGGRGRRPKKLSFGRDARLA